jgi:hypothetical protein
VVAGLCYFVRFNAALNLTNNAAIITQTGATITTAAGDTCILRATASNTVEVLCYTGLATESQAGSVELASAVEAAALSSTSVAMTPGRMKDAMGASGSAPMFACRAWVNFDGTGTPAIRGSGNVSSITDNGAGDYTINFTTAMPDANYATVYGVNANANSSNYQVTTAAASPSSAATLKSTTQLRITVGQTNGSALVDHTEINVVIFR